MNVFDAIRRAAKPGRTPRRLEPVVNRARIVFDRVDACEDAPHIRFPQETMDRLCSPTEGRIGKALGLELKASDFKIARYVPPCPAKARDFFDIIFHTGLAKHHGRNDRADRFSGRP